MHFHLENPVDDGMFYNHSSSFLWHPTFSFICFFFFSCFLVLVILPLSSLVLFFLSELNCSSFLVPVGAAGQLIPDGAFSSSSHPLPDSLFLPSSLHPWCNSSLVPTGQNGTFVSSLTRSFSPSLQPPLLPAHPPHPFFFFFSWKAKQHLEPGLGNCKQQVYGPGGWGRVQQGSESSRAENQPFVMAGLVWEVRTGLPPPQTPHTSTSNHQHQYNTPSLTDDTDWRKCQLGSSHLSPFHF